MARRTDGLHAAGPDVTRKQASMKSFRVPGEKFQGFGYFQGGNQINDRAKDTNSVAGLFEPWRRRPIREGKRGKRSRRDGWSWSVRSSRRRQRKSKGGRIHRDIVDQEASFEIVGAIEKHIDATEKGFGIARLRSATTPSTAMDELMERSLRSAATALAEH